MRKLLFLMICGSVIALQSCKADGDGTDSFKDSMESGKDSTQVTD